MPKSRLDYWRPKIEANRARDKRKRSELEALGWTVIEVWECELKAPGQLEDKLKLAIPSAI
jgi:DNA mismatch endonuclease (patch repair protein)